MRKYLPRESRSPGFPAKGIFIVVLRAAGSGLRLVVNLLRVDVPYIIFGLDAVYDVLHGLEGGDHGVVDIVVAVLAVTSDTVEVVDGL